MFALVGIVVVLAIIKKTHAGTTLSKTWRWGRIPIADVDKPQVYRLHFHWLIDMDANVFDDFSGRCDTCDFGDEKCGPRRGNDLWIHDGEDSLLYSTKNPQSAATDAVPLLHCDHTCFQCLQREFYD